MYSVRFMAIKDTKSVKKSELLLLYGYLFTLTAAVLIGILGRAYLDGQGVNLESAEQELIFIKTVKMLFPSFLEYSYQLFLHRL